MSQHWVSDGDGSDSFEWDSNGNGEEAASFNAAGAPVGPSAALVHKYMDMGFTVFWF